MIMLLEVSLFKSRERRKRKKEKKTVNKRKAKYDRINLKIKKIRKRKIRLKIMGKKEKKRKFFETLMLNHYILYTLSQVLSKVFSSHKSSLVEESTIGP